MTPSTGARMIGEGEIAFGLGERRLEFVEGAFGLFLLRLQHADSGDRGVDGGLRALHAGIASSRLAMRLFKRLPARECLAGERLLALILQLRARLRRLCVETSCACACSTPACCATIWRPMRSMVACWVAALVRAGSTASCSRRCRCAAITSPAWTLALSATRTVAHSPALWRPASLCRHGHKRRRWKP